MKHTKKIYAAEALLAAVSMLALTACGKTSQSISRTETGEAQYDTEKVQAVMNEGQKQGEASEGGAERNQDAGINIIEIRSYSDNEKERMEKLQESYRNEAAKPEKMIQEVDSAENVTEGTLSYITSTGQFYLPDRELSDEELLEIIDCNFRISLSTNRKSQEEWDEITLKERAELEAKVKAAGGISEEAAVEIAKKALETDLGDKGKKLELVVDEVYGWRSDLCVADWSEIKEKDKGAIAYSIGFCNAKEGMDEKELLNYNCVVKAADGSILEAYAMQGWDNTVYYEH